MRGTIDRVREAAVATLLTGAALTAMTASAADPLPNDGYLYRPDAVTSVASVDLQIFNSRVLYTTEAGCSRTVRFAVRTPPGATETPLPVVIVAHGGGELSPMGVKRRQAARAAWEVPGTCTRYFYLTCRCTGA